MLFDFRFKHDFCHTLELRTLIPMRDDWTKLNSIIDTYILMIFFRVDHIYSL